MRIEIHHYHHSGDQCQQPADYSRLLNMLEKIMSQIDDLNTADAAIQADLDKIKAFLTSQSEQLAGLQSQLAQLQQSVPPQVDLSGVVAATNAIKDEADAIVASFEPAAPSGGDTSGAPATGAVGDTSNPPSGGDTSSSGDSSGSTSGSSDTGTPPSGDTSGTPSDGSAGTGSDPTSTLPADGSQSTDQQP